MTTSTIPKRAALVCLVFCIATAVQAQESLSGVGVTVRNQSGGTVVYRGATNQHGGFATPSLPPGTYNVEFRAPKSMNLPAKQQLLISLNVARDTVRNSYAAGEHMRGGVAVSVVIASATNLTGQIAPSAGQATAARGPIPDGMEEVRANVKVINGKRYVWVPPILGSNIGKWAPEGSDEAALSTSNKRGGDTEALQRLQEMSSNYGGGR